MVPKEEVDEWFPIIQRYLLLLGGLFGVGYETIVDHIERPYLLAMFGGMMGLAEAVHSWASREKK